MAEDSVTKIDKSLEPPPAAAAVTPDAEQAGKPPLPQPLYKPYATNPGTSSEAPYEPYAKESAVPELPYEPYKGM